MRKINKFLLINILTIAFISCEKTIEFNGKETEPLLVVNSFVQPDSVLKVEISESVFFLSDESPQKVKDADITVFVNGENLGKMMYYDEETLYYDPIGYYYFDYRPKAGDLIRYEVDVRGFEKVVTETAVPYPVEIISIDATCEKSEYSYSVLHCSMKFQDTPNEQNFYRIVLMRVFTYEDYNGNKQIALEYPPIESDDLVFGGVTLGEGVIAEEYHRIYNIFSDDMIENKEYTIKFKVNTHYGTDASVKYYVSLQTLSKDYYTYLKTRESSENTDDFMSIFSEPIQIYGNIKGGIGIFGAYSVSRKELTDVK